MNGVLSEYITIKNDLTHWRNYNFACLILDVKFCMYNSANGFLLWHIEQITIELVSLASELVLLASELVSLVSKLVSLV